MNGLLHVQPDSIISFYHVDISPELYRIRRSLVETKHKEIRMLDGTDY